MQIWINILVPNHLRHTDDIIITLIFSPCDGMFNIKSVGIAD